MGKYQQEAERIFELADLDGDGFLQFSEWCCVTMDRETVLNKDRLKLAFNIFDADGSGSITIDEV